jgi:hypothetical protein
MGSFSIGHVSPVHEYINTVTSHHSFVRKWKQNFSVMKSSKQLILNQSNTHTVPAISSFVHKTNNQHVLVLLVNDV